MKTRCNNGSSIVLVVLLNAVTGAGSSVMAGQREGAPAKF